MLDVLWALDEETRLRIAALLQHGELTVSDLTDILGMSQPRVSRHLNLLAEAGVVDKHREGTWAFFDLVTHGPIGQLVGQVLALTDVADPVLAADLDRLTIVRSRRTASAQEYFAGIAPRWDEERSLHASDSTVEQTILDTIGSAKYESVLDVGTGTGRMLQLLGRGGEACGRVRQQPLDARGRTGQPRSRRDPWHRPSPGRHLWSPVRQRCRST